MCFVAIGSSLLFYSSKFHSGPLYFGLSFSSSVSCSLYSVGSALLINPGKVYSSSLFNSKPLSLGAPVAQLVKRWPTDLADRVRSSLEVKSSQP